MKRRLSGWGFATAYMALFTAMAAIASSGTLAGRVVDSDTGKPVIGASVQIVGTRTGTVADLDGRFELLSVPTGPVTLRVTAVGFEPVELTTTIASDSGTSLSVELVSHAIEGKTIVVTGTGTPRLYKDAPVRTSVVPAELIAMTQSGNLADALSLQTGVRVENNCQNCSFTQLRLLGMEGKYSQILVDGDPVVSSLAGVYGLEQFPDELIEQVEVVKGGGSALYGGSAVAGVVNMRTRRPFEDAIALEYGLSLIGDAAENSTSFTVSRLGESSTASGYVFGSLTRGQDWDANGDGFTEIGRIANESIGTSVFITPSANTEITVGAHYIHEDRRGGNRLDVPPHEADVTEAAETHRYGGSLNWSHQVSPTFNYSTRVALAHLERDTYYGSHRDPNAYGATKNPLGFAGIRAIRLIGSHEVIVGFDAKLERLEDRALGYDHVIDQTYSTIGGYVQDSYSFGGDDQFEFVAGVRLDQHSEVTSAIVSPRAAGRIHVSEALTLRTGVSTGYNPPQIFDEDLHILIVGGDRQTIRNAEDLREERAVTVNAGADYNVTIGDADVEISTNVFSTRLSDAFQLDEQESDAGIRLLYRVNGDGADVRGVEWDMTMRYNDWQLVGGLTLQRSTFDSPDPDFQSTNFFRTPDVYGSLRSLYDVFDRLRVLAAMKYTGPMDLPHYAGYIEEDRLDRSPSFVEFDLDVSYDITLASGRQLGTLSVGVHNITDAYQDDFDRGVDRDAGYIYGPRYPRRLVMSLSSQF